MLELFRLKQPSSGSTLPPSEYVAVSYPSIERREPVCDFPEFLVYRFFIRFPPSVEYVVDLTVVIQLNLRNPCRNLCHSTFDIHNIALDCSR